MQRKIASFMRSSAAIIGGNDDLLMEILVLLPVKSLVRFQLVSKHWHSLISNPSFSHIYYRHRHRHRRRPEPQLSFILRTITSHYFICNPATKRLVPFHFKFPSSKFPFVKILQSCNGLLLLECRNTPYGRQEYYIFNPTTMQSRNLFISRPFSGLCLMFDPSKSRHYVVVCFRSDNHCTSFLLYDSRTRRWKNGGECNEGSYKFCDGVYWKDGLYFIRTRGSSSFCYSLKDKIHSVINPPRIQPQGAKRSYIMESNGHMHYIVLALQPTKNRLLVFEMQDDEYDWYEKYYYRADFSSISATIPANNGIAIELLGMIRGNKDKDSFLLFHVPGKIMIYRFFHKVFDVVVDFRREYYFQEDRLQFGFKDAHRFIESLASV